MSFVWRLAVGAVVLVLFTLIGTGPAVAAVDCDGDGMETVKDLFSVEGAIECGTEWVGAVLKTALPVLLVVGTPVAGVGLWRLIRHTSRRL